MDWNELLTILMQVVIIPAIPIIVTFLVKFCKAKTDEAISTVNNETLRQALSEATDAVYTAVTYTSQTYVDSLKEQGTFDKEAQIIALNTALKKAQSLLAAETKELLESLYGDLDNWLTTKIEQTVKEQKLIAA